MFTNQAKFIWFSRIIILKYNTPDRKPVTTLGSINLQHHIKLMIRHKLIHLTTLERDRIEGSLNFGF